MNKPIIYGENMRKTGVVIIGRNESARLRASLNSVPQCVDKIIYVDSGSTDGSVEIARQEGALVVTLDAKKPFTAARARNAGFERLQEVTKVEFVQFIDGDCILNKEWIDAATIFIQENPECAIVCGRRREKDPSASVFNRLCDVEWATPIGPAVACGGDFLARSEAFREVGGFDRNMIAGEEPELCQRLRQKGWSIWRLDRDMTLHDANMHRFSQWWKRSRRGGFAAAEGMARHGWGPDRHGVAQTSRAMFWGVFFPFAIVLAAYFVNSWSFMLLFAYPAQIFRLYLRRVSDLGHMEWAIFSVMSKFPEAIGVIQFAWTRFLGTTSELIEYK